MNSNRVKLLVRAKHDCKWLKELINEDGRRRSFFINREQKRIRFFENIACFPLRGKLFVKANPLSLSLEKLELDQSKIEWRLNNALHDHREREREEIEITSEIGDRKETINDSIKFEVRKR